MLPASVTLPINRLATPTTAVFEKASRADNRANANRFLTTYVDSTAGRNYLAPRMLEVQSADFSSQNVRLMFGLTDNQVVSFVSSGGGTQESILKCKVYTVIDVQRPRQGQGAFTATNPFTLPVLRDMTDTVYDMIVRNSGAHMLLDRAIRGET